MAADIAPAAEGDPSPGPEPGGDGLADATLALCFSGAAALINEVAWNRSWVLVFGSTTGSTATVLAVFMLGLGLGGRYYRLAGRLLRARGVALYRRLELVVAAGAIVAPLGLMVADRIHLDLVRELGVESWLLPVARLLMSVAVLVPVTFAMGASLPAMAEELPVGSDGEAGLARLYSWNTLGAVLGVVTGGYVLLPRLGIQGMTWAAAGCSVLAAWVAGGPERPGRETSARAQPSGPDPSGGPGRGEPALAIYAFVGFWAMALEVLFTRAALTAAAASTYAVAAVLAAFLAGMALGSAAGARWPSRDAVPMAALARRLALVGLLVAASTVAIYHHAPIYIFLFGRLGGNAGAELATWGLAALLLLPAGVGLGALFPVAARCLTGNGSPARGAGRAYFVNSLGGTAGALVAHHLIAPAAGIAGGLVAASASFLLAGAWIHGRVVPGGLRTAGCLVGLAAALVAIGRSHPLRLTYGVYEFADDLMEARDQAATARQVEQVYHPDLLWYRDGADASIAITSLPGGDRGLLINGRGAATLKGDREMHTMLGTLPFLLRPPGARGLMIGLGSGCSADAVLCHPVASLDVAELAPTVLAAALDGFRGAFPCPFADPRCRIHIADGRVLVRAWPGSVDAIVCAPNHLYLQGASDLYTREFLSACRERLVPGGLFVSWFPATEMSAEGLAMMIRTVAEVFPHQALAWYATPIFLASDRPIAFDAPVVRAALARPEVAESLRAAGLRPNLASLVEGLLAREAVLCSWAGPGPILTDDLPALEFLAARSRFDRASKDLKASLLQLEQDSHFESAVPVTDLLEVDPGRGARFPEAGLRFAPALEGGTASLRRTRGSQGPKGEPARSVQYSQWEHSSEAGRVVLQGFDEQSIGDPAFPHHDYQDAARRAGLGVPGLRLLAAHGHPATWLAFPGARGLEHAAVLSWRCPLQKRIYVLTARAGAAAGDEALMSAVVAGVGCLHPGQDDR